MVPFRAVGVELPKPLVHSSTGAALRGSLPGAISPGTLNYYVLRNDDFVQRNPGHAPPSYYLDYGNVYVRKFAAIKGLSPAGRAWRVKTSLLLQQRMELARAANGKDFARLERDDQGFKDFAFGLHPDAYIDGGIFKLPAEDMAKVVQTVSLHDWLSHDGVDQLARFIEETRPSDLRSVVIASLRERLSQVDRFLTKP